MDADVCVVGGGIVGLTFARLLQKQRPDWEILLLDGKAGGDDGTSVVVNAAVADVLRALQALPENSRPIRRVRVSFTGGGGHHLGGGRDALGYGIAHQTVQADLARGVNRITARATGVGEEEKAVVIHTDNNGDIRARALVVACAAPFLPPPFHVKTLDYRQAVLSLTTAAVECGDADALQHFGDDGVAVMVPRADGDAGVILCAPAAVAAKLNALSDDALAAHLRKEFNLPARRRERLLVPQGRRFAYAPRLTRAAPLAYRRIALIGQAATTLHPIGAQGLNLGVGDAQQLAIAFGNNDNMTATMRHYARARRAAHCKTAALTSVLALGVRFRARPLRLFGGAVAAALSRPAAQQLFLPTATALH